MEPRTKMRWCCRQSHAHRRPALERALAGIVLLSCIAGRTSGSSSTAEPSRSQTPSLSPDRGWGGPASGSAIEEEPAEEPKKIRELGILEGRTRETHFLHAEPEIADDEVEGAYVGRNRKKKKHRRLHAVEVQVRKLEETDGLMADGSLNVPGLLKLASAQEERDAAPDGIVRDKEWTLEELDKAYPDPEGNKRLGLKDTTVHAVTRRAKWERSSHLVDMHAPGSQPNVIPEDVLNYRLDRQNMTVLVMGSMGLFLLHLFLCVADSFSDRNIRLMPRSLHYSANI